ncbi:MAG TPA: hypothetical protein VN704_09110 [Verrucomicrobiae bacterium]|nr:hypothetical protein [Verrucomicrobiae bacterium]
MATRKMTYKKEGYLKYIYTAVNIKTKKIIAMMKVTNEHFHENKKHYLN